MKTPIAILLICFMVVLESCSKEFASPEDSNIGVFEELLHFVEENYALFEIKQVDWERVKAHYRPKVSNLITRDSFFSICQSVVTELKDGQASVSNNYLSQSPYDYTAGYDVQFKREIALGYVEQAFNYYSVDTWVGTVNDSTAYAHIESFYDFDYDHWQTLVAYLTRDQHKKIILDLRDALSGTPADGFNFVRYFLPTPTNVGSMVHKSGKGSKDLKKVPVIIQPASPHIGSKKIVILTNRYSFNIATYVTAILENLPNVTLIGQTTGPGSGVELPYELPNGWIVSVSSNYFLPANGQHIEDGIRPDIEINNTATDLQNKRDRMLERAIAY